MKKSRRQFCQLAAASPLLLSLSDPARAAGSGGAGEAVTFHFYGAEDCPPCMAFKRDGLPKVQDAAKAQSFDVAVNIIKRTRDVPALGSYGATDPLLRRAVETLSRTYPPIFFVTEGGEVLSVWEGKWEEALAFAVRRAQSQA